MPQLTFLIGQDGRNVKRTHSRRACTPCRRKKKRCFHDISANSDGSAKARSNSPEFEPESLPQQSPNSPPRSTFERHNTLSTLEVEHLAVTSPIISTASSSHTGPVAEESNSRPFACDTNPVVALLDDPQSRLKHGQSRRGDVGAWLPEDRIDSYLDELHSLPTHAEYDNPHPTGSAQLLPPKTSQAVLVDIYFCQIHPLLPLIDAEETRSQIDDNTISLPLLQSICLVAAKDRKAAPFLYLNSDKTLLPLERFSQRLYKAILSNIRQREDGKRVTTIQILALLSLHEWGPNGSENSSLCLAQAIHHAQTIGLHLKRPGRELASPLKKLFWCLWSLDRWNCAIHGRPVIIHERDIGQDVIEIIPSFEPPFRLWLLLAHYLTQVIVSYRPIMDTSDEQELDIPTFEELVKSADCWNTRPELLDSLELFHHAILILATRSQHLQGRSASRISTIRQSQSILTIAALYRTRRVEELLPISMSAYSLSLAFSVTYCHMKEAKLSSAQLVAKENLAIFHRCLRSLSSIWWLAAVVMQLGKHALENTHQPEPESTTGAERLSGENADFHEELQAGRGVFVDPSGTSENLSSSDGGLSAPAFSEDLDHLFEKYDLSSAEEGYFDTFFQNFLDVNFPSSLGEQYLEGKAGFIA